MGHTRVPVYSALIRALRPAREKDVRGKHKEL